MTRRTIDSLAKSLLEDETKRNIDVKVAVFVERLILRLMADTSLSQFFVDQACIKKSDKEYVIQLGFHRLPRELMSQMDRLIAAPSLVKWQRYVKDGAAMVGAEFKVSPDDMGGEDYEYGQ